MERSRLATMASPLLLVEGHQYRQRLTIIW